MKSFLARRVVLAVVLIAGTTIVGVALAGQALTHKTHEASNVIRACVKQEGQLRVVDSESDCKKNETALAWNVQGPQGAPGIGVTTAPLAAGNAHCAAGGL